jgi:hypothetical protein
MSKPSDAGAWLKTHPRLRVQLGLLDLDAYVLINKIWLWCQDTGSNGGGHGRVHVDDLHAACDRIITPARITKALTRLERPQISHRDGTQSPLWLAVVDGWVVMPVWWLDDNPGPEIWNDEHARARLARNKALGRMPELCERIKTRDRSLCRYCGVRVRWGANNSDQGGTYDHVDPDGENKLSDVVVACRRCNGRKKDRTPEQWIEDDPAGGLSLLPAGTTAVQAAACREARAGPEPVEPGSDPGSTGVRPGSDRLSRPRASPDRDRPGSNRGRTATGPASTRTAPRTRTGKARAGQPSSPSDQDLGEVQT